MRLSNKAREAVRYSGWVLSAVLRIVSLVSRFCVYMTSMELAETLIFEKLVKCGLHKIEGECSLKTGRTWKVLPCLGPSPLPIFYCSGSAAVTVMIKGYKQDKKRSYLY